MLWTSKRTPEIISDWNALEKLGDQISEDRVLVCTSKTVLKINEVERFIAKLHNDGKQVSLYSAISPNPTYEDVVDFAKSALIFQPKVLVGIGGGSVLDFTKLLRLILNDANVPSFEDITKKDHYIKRKHKLIAVPTTCGSGAEITPFVAVWDKIQKRKFSIENDLLCPDVCVLSGRLSATLPSELLLYSSLDAISHCIESLWNRNRNSYSSNFAFIGLSGILEALPNLISNSSDKGWQVMQESAFYAGLAISQTHTALAHSISYPLTAHYGVPHGLASSFSIPFIWDWIDPEIRKMLPHDGLIAKAVALLTSFDLVQHLMIYISMDQLYELRSEMIDPVRSTNFIVSPLDDVVDQLIDALI